MNNDFESVVMMSDLRLVSREPMNTLPATGVVYAELLVRREDNRFEAIVKKIHVLTLRIYAGESDRKVTPVAWSHSATRMTQDLE